MKSFINQLVDKVTQMLAKKIGEDKAKKLVELGCFCLVGGINTLVDMGIFSLIYYVVLSGNPDLFYIPFAIGYLCGVVCSFVLNKIFTFRDEGSTKTQWAPFLAVNLISLGAGQGGMALLGMVSINGILAKIITVPVTLAINYIGSKLFVFKK